MKHQSIAIRKKESEIVEMKKKVAAATELVNKVMAQEKATLAAYEIKFADLELFELLGEGSFGRVVRGTLRGEHEVAVKTMRIAKITEEELEKFKRELTVRALSSIL